MSTTTSDNLPKAPPTLSLSPSASSFDFSKPFTLVSADGHSFSVDPLKLAGTSSVFADMLSSGGGDRTCTLSETKEEVEAYLAAIEGSLESVSEATWLALFRMSDKYEAPAVRSVLSSVACDWLTSQPKQAYIAASLVGNRELAKAAALPTLAQSGTSSRPEQGAKAFLSELSTVKTGEKYGLAYLSAQKQLLLNSHPTTWCSEASCKTKFGLMQKFWNSMTRSAAADVQFSTPLGNLLVQKLNSFNYDLPECRGCLRNIHNDVEKLLMEWETGPNGKKSIKLFD